MQYCPGAFGAVFGASHRSRGRPALGFIGSFCDLFFVLSGVIITHVYGGRVQSLRSYGEFMLRRVARLVPLHWAMLAVFVIAYFATSAVDIHSVDATCFVPNLLLLQAAGFCESPSFNAVSWSISAEFVLYAAFPLLVIFRFHLILPFLAAALILALLVIFSPGDSWLHWTAPFGFLRALPSFLIGIGCQGLRGHLSKLPVGGAAVVGVFSLIVGGVVLGVGYLWLLAIIYLVAITAVAADSNGSVWHITRRLAPLAQLTYSIYMIHVVVVLTVMGGAKRLLHLQPAMTFMLAIGVSLTIIALAYLCYFTFERPARKWVSNLAIRQPASMSSPKTSMSVETPRQPIDR
jgi:peptidoglycan/LPS O-acetylase OafA/YrhL